MNQTQKAEKIYNIHQINNADFADGKQKPHFRNIPTPGFFIGREDLLAEIHQKLQQDEPVVLMNGLGGIGKTTAAHMYVNQYKDSYKHIASVFVASDLRQSIVDSLKNQLGIDFPPNSSLAQQFETVILALQQMKPKKKPNLLLLDNANDKQALINAKYDLKSSGWKVLITSRCQPDDYTMVAVTELSPAAAMDLFLKYYPTDSDLLPRLLEKIYYHTLMIELIAKAGKKKRLSVEQLLERLDTGLSHQDLQREITVGSHADSQLKEKQARLYEYILAMFEPADLSEEKQRILRYFSVLPAEDIPLVHLKTLFAVEDDNQFEDDLDSLFQYGWLSAKDDSYKMHALVQDVVFAKSSNDYKTLIAALEEIMQQNLSVAYDYLDYAKSVTQKITNAGYEIGWLNLNLSNNYKNIGQLENALASIKIASEHFKNSDEQYSLAVSYERIGKIHQALGQVDKALEFFELYNELSKELYDSNPKSESLKNELAISYERLGNIHEVFGQLEKALAFFELQNDLFKELYESNPKSENLKNFLAISYTNLGGIHQALGQVDKALEFFELYNELSKELYDSNPKSESLKNELAISYERLGNIHEVFGQLEKALAFFELQNDLFKELYESNPKSENLKNFLAISYTNLGGIHQALGQVDKALEFFELETDLFKELYDSNPKSESLKNGLAISYEKLGNIHQALGQVDKALEFFELYNELSKELYDSNPKSESLKNWLAISYSKLGDIHQALGQVDKALEFFELSNELSKELYDSNPKSESLKNWLAISYERLGNIHKVFGQLEKALAFFELQNDLFKELYGSNPKSENLKNFLAISYANLGGIHQALGQVDKALEFFELRTKLGKELYDSNPKSESLKNGLAISCEKLGSIHQALGQVDKALEFFELYNELSKEFYDSNPKSVQLKNGLAISYSKLGDIYQAKKIPFYKFTAIRHNRHQILAMYENAMNLWEELYQTTQLDSYKHSLEKIEQVHLQVKAASYAPLVQATLIALFGGLYWLDWVSSWWLVGLVIWIWPLRLPVKTVLSIKISLLVLLGLVAWFF